MKFLEFLAEHRTPFFDRFFSIVTYLGWETIFLVVALVLIWCINKKYGFFILYCGLIGQAASQWLKLIFKVERPWVAFPDFKPIQSAIEDAGGYSFPSGHTQIATTTYGGLALLYRKKKWLSATLIIAVLLVGFSRMYLGVHYPTDVIFSLVFNTALIISFYLVGKRYTGNGTSSILRIIGLLAMGSLLVYSIVMFNEFSDVEVYADTLSFSSKMFGATLAFVISWYIDDKYLDFKTEASLPIQIFKVVVGTAVLLTIKEGLKPLFLIIGLNTTVGNIIRYFFVVLFAGTIWPYFFIKIVKKR